MNIETKTTREDTSEYEKFGWKHTEDTRRRTGPVHHIEHILARDKDMKNYRSIKTLEDKYFALKEQKQTYKPIDGGTCFMLFLLLLIPGFIYISYKTKQKENIEYQNKCIQVKMDAILKEVKPLLAK